MNKVGILTFHRAINYGAVFQTYALYKTVENLGADVEVIDYRAEFNERRFRKKTMKELMKPRNLYSILFRNSYKKYNREIFDAFMNRVELSERCLDKESLSGVCRKYDTVVCGSDQVWNIACTEGDDSYFLPFIDEPSKKKAYAASIGYDAIPSDFSQKYREWIRSFSAVSVREKSAVEAIGQACDVKSEYVVDPTLLLCPDEWRKIASYSRVPSSDYVFLYLMSEDKNVISFAKRLAKDRKCKLVYVTDRLFSLKGAVNLRDVSPEEWIGLLDKASYVVTNSFHGTAFSVNFNKQFFIRYIPRSIANSRLKCILEEYNLQHREIDSMDNSVCDFKYTNETIIKNVRKSVEFLKHEVIGE